VSLAKTPEVPFEVKTRVGPRNRMFYGLGCTSVPPGEYDRMIRRRLLVIVAFCSVCDVSDIIYSFISPSYVVAENK